MFVLLVRSSCVQNSVNIMQIRERNEDGRKKLMSDCLGQVNFAIGQVKIQGQWPQDIVMSKSMD